MSEEWLVVATKPLSEEVASRSLRGAGWRVYLPRYKRLLRGVRIGADGRRHRTRGAGEVVLRPLFPGYLFAEWDGRPWSEVVRLTGVMGLVGSREARLRGEPEVLSGEVVELIRETERSGEFDDVRSGKRGDLRVGEMVRVAELGDVVGRLKGLDEAGRATVLLEFMGREVRARVGAEGLMAAVG